jgi:exopolyphosphatase/guanosine-5'-triphosphate,3'-diphosphate pyrophosphatase
MESLKVAVLDLGTNTFNLLLAKMTRDAYFLYHNEKIPVKIGQGGINKRIITGDAQERALKALLHYKDIIQKEGITKIYGYATSAFRNARNGADFRDFLERKTALPINIISGETEAKYIYYGVCNALNLGEEKSLIMDIGGGSVEFIIADNKKIHWLQSIEIGAQRLLDKFHTTDPIPKKEIENLNSYLDNKLEDVLNAVEKHQPKTLVGSSGTFDTLSEIYCHRNKSALQLDDTEYPLDKDAYLSIHNELIDKDKEARLKIPGMIVMRVDMIVVASSLIKYLLDNYSFESIRVSAHSLKEGMLHYIQKESTGELTSAAIS